jgi:hypothetical protein
MKKNSLIIFLIFFIVLDFQILEAQTLLDLDCDKLNTINQNFNSIQEFTQKYTIEKISEKNEKILNESLADLKLKKEKLDVKSANYNNRKKEINSIEDNLNNFYNGFTEKRVIIVKYKNMKDWSAIVFNGNLQDKSKIEYHADSNGLLYIQNDRDKTVTITDNILSNLKEILPNIPEFMLMDFIATSPQLKVMQTLNDKLIHLYNPLNKVEMIFNIKNRDLKILRDSNIEFENKLRKDDYIVKRYVDGCLVYTEDWNYCVPTSDESNLLNEKYTIPDGYLVYIIRGKEKFEYKSNDFDLRELFDGKNK